MKQMKKQTHTPVMKKHHTPVIELLAREAEQLARRGDGALAEQARFSAQQLFGPKAQAAFYRACRAENPAAARAAVFMRD